MHPIVNIAVKAARLAGNIILRAQDHSDSLTFVEKGYHDYTSKVDKEAEEIIIETIQRAYPQHSILAEESGLNDASQHECQWIIDPLDGTTNFLHGFPQYCVSIAFKEDGKVLHGVIYDPIRDELYTASRGRGAQLNDRRLRVSKAEKLDLCLLGTGFPFRELDYLEDYLAYFRALIPQCAGIRRAGAAALDLAYVAAGRLDGFWEFGLKPWDIAAGSLMIQEAGGFVSTIEGDPEFLNANTILVGNPKIHQQMVLLYKQLKTLGD